MESHGFTQAGKRAAVEAMTMGWLNQQLCWELVDTFHATHLLFASMRYTNPEFKKINHLKCIILP